MTRDALLPTTPPSRSIDRRRRPRRRALAAAVALVVAAVPSLAAVGPAAAAGDDVCAALDPFDDAWVASYVASIGGAHVAAAVEDVSSGCTFRFGATDAFPTASTAKVEIMGALFLSLQDRGITTLDAGTAARVRAMITVSDNDAADALYTRLGGAAALDAYGRRLGLTTTASGGYSWGGIGTTPDDQLRLLRTVLVGGGALDAAWVAQARSFMQAVDASQDWGVSAGVPTGSIVAVKNGWLYNDGSFWGTANRWRVNTTGMVQLPNGRRYLLAVYGNEWTGMDAGIAALERVATRAAAALGAPRAQPVTSPLADGGRSAVTPVASAFSAVAPVRLLDTRITGTAVAAGGTVTLDVRDADGTVPAAVAVNVTAVGAAAAGYVTAYPSGGERPLASVLDQLPDRVVADVAVVPVGADGRIVLYASTSTHLVVDLLGRWTAADGAVAAGRYRSVDPARLVDTRVDGTGPAAGGTLTVAVAGRGGVPASGVSAVVVTVTAPAAARAGYWTVWPTGVARPLASTLVAATDAVVANTAIVPVGADGSISLYAQSGGDVVVDVVGWFTDGTVAEGTDGRFVALATPDRVADTRYGTGGTDRLTDGGTQEVTVDGVPSDATAVAAVLTTTEPVRDGYVTVHAVGADRPLASATNPSVAVGTTATGAFVGVSGAQFAAYAASSTELVVDVAGWFTP